MMGEFKPMASGDGSWAHPPEDDVAVGQALAGPFVVTEMPARPPTPPPPSPKTQHLLRGVAGPDGGDD